MAPTVMVEGVVDPDDEWVMLIVELSLCLWVVMVPFVAWWVETEGWADVVIEVEEESARARAERLRAMRVVFILAVSVLFLFLECSTGDLKSNWMDRTGIGIEKCCLP